MKKTFQNNGEKEHCILEAECGKKYKLTIQTDGRIHFQYVITNDTHTDTLFMGPGMDKRGASIHFTHIIEAQKTGHLSIRNIANNDNYWKTMTVTIEEV